MTQGVIQDVKHVQELFASGAARRLTLPVEPPEGVVGAAHIRNGALVVHDGLALPVVHGKTSTFYFGEFHASKYAAVLEASPVLNGEIAHAVFIRGSANYFNFLVYHCVALYLLKTMPTKTRVTIATVNGFPPYAASLMARLLPIFSGGRAVDIVTIAEGRTTLTDVIVPFKPVPYMTGVLSRQVIMPLVLRDAGLTNPLRQLGPLKLFLRRENAGNGRNLSNQAEVEAWFVQRGYTAVNPGAMTIDEQVIVFARATHIAGVEGAAFTNILFALAAAQVLVIASPNTAGETFFAALSKPAHAVFHVVYGEVAQGPATGRNADYHLPLAALEGLDQAVVGA